jgi:hypothetical protein
LELENAVLNHVQSVRAALVDHSLAVRRPVLVNHIERVVAQLGLNIGPHRLRIPRGVPIERGERRSFGKGAAPHLVEVLVGGNRQEAQKKAVEQAEARGRIRHQLVDAGLPSDDQTQERLDENDPEPGQPDEEQGAVDGELDGRDPVDEVRH